MLDLIRIRNNPQEVVDALAKKGYKADFTDVIKWDDERKATITQATQSAKEQSLRTNPRSQKSGTTRRTYL